MDGEQERLARLFERLRSKLLDESLRNPLISYKHRPSSKRQLRFVDAIPEEIYRRLVVDSTPVQLLPLPEPDELPADERTSDFLSRLEYANTSDAAYLAKVQELEGTGLDGDLELAAAERELRDRVRVAIGLPPRTTIVINAAEHAVSLGIEPSCDLDAECSKSGHEDKILQSLSWPAAFDALVSKIADEAHLAEQEMGLSTLFLVFGFLEWFEDDRSDRPHMAPLLLLPVELESKRTAGRKTTFTLRATAEVPEINLSLKKRIDREFKRILPEFQIDEEAVGSIEAYLQEVGVAIEGQKRWRVRRQLTLGHFAFGRLAMYADLAPDKWGAHPVTRSLVGSVLSGSEIDGDGGTSLLGAPEDHCIDDPAIEAIAPFLVHDADASQHSALVDALLGENLVIRGPPGTGKSQTIANLIANAIGQGKKVLFLAEKQAALDVVKRRMDKAGLGDFCLELHSDRAALRKVIESLRSRHALGYSALAQRIGGSAPTPVGMPDAASCRAIWRTSTGPTMTVARSSQ